MSTKTTIKRIALTAVVALGFGMVSTVSANAAGLAGDAVALSAYSSSATVSVASTTTATFTGYCVAAGDLGVYAIYIKSLPSAGSGTLSLALTAGTISGPATIGQSGGTATDAVTVTCTGTGFFTATATASATVPSAGNYGFAVAGVYQASGIQTWSVTAAPKGAITAASSTISATTVTGSMANGVSAGSVTVAANNAGGNADAAVLSATVSGPGLVSWSNFAAAGRAVQQAANNAGTLTFYGDGTAGVGTVSIYSGSTLLGKVTATFYGAVTKLVVTPLVYSLSDAAASTAFATVTALDANGVAVPLAAADGAPSVTNGAFVDAVSALTTGGVDLKLDPAALAYGKTATTWTHTATGLTVDASVLVASTTAATLAVAVPSDSLVPGQKYTITVTAKDANGYAIPDDAARAVVISTSRASSVAVPATAKFVNGVASIDLYAPVTPGDFSVTVTDSAVATATNTQTVALGNQSQDAIDAANEATDAANAATDAANAAAEAADAATAAAQDAQAAVAELATSVAALIAGIKAQITTLTNLVIKIQKKVAVTFPSRVEPE